MDATLAQELSPRSVSNISKIAAMALLFVITYLPVFADLRSSSCFSFPSTSGSSPPAGHRGHSPGP